MRIDVTKGEEKNKTSHLSGVMP